MRNWWRRLRDWFCPPNPVALCVRDHMEDHVCWDWYADYVMPGDMTWFCNKCKRSWLENNPHKTLSEIDRERRRQDLHTWGEYDQFLKTYWRNPMSSYNEKKLEKLKKERRNAESNNKR